MKCIVIVKFKDLKDNSYPYEVGDDYPREGLSVSKKRINELASDKNRRKMPLIGPKPLENTETAAEAEVPEVPANAEVDEAPTEVAVPEAPAEKAQKKTVKKGK